jgi:hypothetical protein
MEQFPVGGAASGQTLAANSVLNLTPDQILLYKNIKPDLVENISDSAFYDNSLYAMMLNMGMVETTTTTENYHYENGSYFAPATVASVNTASASAITLVYTTSSVSGSSGSYLSPGMVGDNVLINGQYVCVVTAKSASLTNNATHSITIDRGDITDFALNDTSVVAAGSILTFPFSTQVSGQDFPDGINVTQTRYKTPLHYMMTSTSEVLSDLANQETYIRISGNDGSKYFIEREDVALTIRHAIKKASALLIANGSTYSYTVDSVAKSAPSTVGLYPTAAQYGTVTPISPGMMDLDDIYNAAARARSGAQAGNEILGLLGTTRRREWDNIFRTDFQNGAFVYNNTFSTFSAQNGVGGMSRIGQDEAKQHAIMLGFGSVNVLGVTIHVKTPTEFEHPTIFNVSGLQNSYYQNTLLMTPAGKTVSFNGNTLQGISFGIKTRMGVVGNGFNAPRQQVRQVNQTPANFGSERFKKTLIEEFGLTTYNASKFQLITP